MRPITVAVGMTAVLAALALRLLEPTLEVLAPFSGPLLRAYWLLLVLYGGLAIAASVTGFYALARTLGLADLGRRLGLVERSIRRGEGDTALRDALGRDEGGAYPE